MANIVYLKSSNYKLIWSIWIYSNSTNRLIALVFVANAIFAHKEEQNSVWFNIIHIMYWP